MGSRANFIWILVVIWIILSLAACGGDADRAGPAPPPEVTVGRPLKKEVTQWLVATGTAAPIESVEIRARVQGFLESVEFEPREKVKAGKLLFSIDPKPFQAKVNQAKAVLKGKEAQLNLAQIELDKATRLAATQSIAEIKSIEATAQRDLAKADVEKATSDLDEAQLNLDYTRVKSPISGKVSRNLVDVGNLVGAGERTLLTTIVNDESIHVYFNLSEMDLLPIVRRYAAQKGDLSATEKMERDPTPAYVGLADEEGYPHEGRMDFADTSVDSKTGTIQVRAILPNKNGLIFPGMFLRVRVPARRFDTLLAPDLAVQADQSGKYLLLVDDNNVVEHLKVETGQLVGKMRVILKGLSENDRIIVNGLQRARPGAKVKPMEAPPNPPGNKNESKKGSSPQAQTSGDSGKPGPAKD